MTQYTNDMIYGWAGGKFIRTPNAGDKFYTSPDGATWTEYSMYTLFGAYGSFNRPNGSSPTLFVTSFTSSSVSRLARTNDMVSWTLETLPSGYTYNLATGYFGGLNKFFVPLNATWGETNSSTFSIFSEYAPATLGGLDVSGSSRFKDLQVTGTLTSATTPLYIKPGVNGPILDIRDIGGSSIGINNASGGSIMMMSGATWKMQIESAATYTHLYNPILSIGEGITGISNYAGIELGGPNCQGAYIDFHAGTPGSGYAITDYDARIMVNGGSATGVAGQGSMVINAVAGITVDGTLSRLTGAGYARWLQQDGMGRSHWYWNTNGTTVPVFGVAGESAADLCMTVDNATGGGGQLYFKSAYGLGKAAGDAITWTTVLAASLNVFQYMGSNILTVANIGSQSPLTLPASCVIKNEGVAGEGGQIIFQAPVSGAVMTGDIIYDHYAGNMRWFETSGTQRGCNLDLSTAAAGSASQILHTGNAAAIINGMGISGGPTNSIQAVNFNAVKDYRYFVNTNTAAITATLPAAPAQFTTIEFCDYHGSFATFNLTIARNGSLIMELAEDLIVNVTNANVKLVYLDATIGWKVI
jgi:hypothetical protein